MSIRDELVGATIIPCKLCAYMAGLNASDRGEWNEALALPVEQVGNSAVVAALKRRQIVVDERSVRRHRRNHIVTH